MNTAVHKNSNITALIEADLGPPLKRSGRWLQWHCPFHGDNHTPSLSVALDNSRYYCFGCQANGDSITWLREFRRMSFSEARTLVSGPGLDGNTIGQTPMPKQAPNRSQPDRLQVAWREVIHQCADLLQSPTAVKTRDYLLQRGLNEETVTSPFHRLGYSPGCKIAGVWVDRGIVLPCFTTTPDLEIDYVSYIKVRRPEGEPKYRKLDGHGSSLTGLYGAGWLRGANAIFITEGEFDCLLLHQEAGDLVGVATLGGASDRLDFAQFGRNLLGASHVFVVYDNDQAGERGANYWQGLGGRVHTVHVPSGNDITEYWQQGGDLASWVMKTLSEHKVL